MRQCCRSTCFCSSSVVHTHSFFFSSFYFVGFSTGIDHLCNSFVYLFDMTGKVIGIHSRVGASKEESMHVPLREFQAHWEELEKSDFVGEGPFAKKPVPGSGFLGMLVEDDLEKKGLRVTELWEKGPAEKAGIKVGDVISEVEGGSATKELLKSTLGHLGSGQKILIKWTSGEETQEKEVKLEDRP